MNGDISISIKVPALCLGRLAAELFVTLRPWLLRRESKHTDNSRYWLEKMICFLIKYQSLNFRLNVVKRPCVKFLGGLSASGRRHWCVAWLSLISCILLLHAPKPLISYLSLLPLHVAAVIKEVLQFILIYLHWAMMYKAYWGNLNAGNQNCC